MPQVRLMRKGNALEAGTSRRLDPPAPPGVRQQEEVEFAMILPIFLLVLGVFGLTAAAMLGAILSRQK